MTGLPLLAIIRITAYLLVTLTLIPVQMLLVRFDWRRGRRFARWYHRLCLDLLGFTVEIVGEPVPGRPTLFISNHASYLDITILGSVLAGSFVAKSEVAGWPLFGTLARLQRTVFVDRKRGSTAQQRDGISERLEAGDDLILFPEGTSSDGIHVLPFKSALFSVADRTIGGQPLTVQPVSLAYVRLDGMPLGRDRAPFFAWYGDMDLGQHLWRVAGLGRATIELTFHAPVSLAELGSRKNLAAHCYKVVAAGVAASLAGRGPPPHIGKVSPAAAAQAADAQLQHNWSSQPELDRPTTDARVN